MFSLRVDQCPSGLLSFFFFRLGVGLGRVGSLLSAAFVFFFSPIQWVCFGVASLWTRGSLLARVPVARAFIEKSPRKTQPKLSLFRILENEMSLTFQFYHRVADSIRSFFGGQPNLFASLRDGESNGGAPLFYRQSVGGGPARCPP